MAVNLQTEFHIKKQRLKKYGLHVKYSTDPPKTPLGTGGPIKRAEQLLGNSEPFLVLNGDIFADLGYEEIAKAHEKRGALATIALYEVEDPSRYGVAEIRENGRIERFIEKPAKNTEPSKLINAGIYVLDPEVFSYIPKGKAVSMEREIFPKLAEQGKLYGYIYRGLWIDIGKPEEYFQTNKMLLDYQTKTQKLMGTVKFKVQNPVAFDKNVSIGENSVIGPYAILGKNVTVGKSVRIENSVVFQDAKIEDYASIKGGIIGEGVIVGKRAKIVQGCIVGDHAKIRDNVALTEESAICPAKEVTEDILKSKIIC